MVAELISLMEHTMIDKYAPKVLKCIYKYEFFYGTPTKKTPKDKKEDKKSKTKEKENGKGKEKDKKGEIKEIPKKRIETI